MNTDDKTRPLCPGCGSPETLPVLEATDHTVSGQQFTIRECRSCSLRFTSPVPAQDEIGRFYQSEDYISHSDTRTGLVNKLYHLVRIFSLRQKKKWVETATARKTGRLLDIGCGTGAFLHVMKEGGWVGAGLEPDGGARQVAAEKYGLSVLAPGELYRLPRASFEAVTLWHVLEHVHDLHGYLDQIRTLLVPGGKAFVAVPNYTSPDARKYASGWAAYDVPRHLYHFSPAAFGSLAARHGFRVVRHVPMPFDAFYISLLSEKYVSGRTSYLSSLLTGLHSWRNARRRPLEASSVLYILDRERHAAALTSI